MDEYNKKKFDMVINELKYKFFISSRYNYGIDDY